METKFTPGPWGWKAENNGEFYRLIAEGRKDSFGCDLVICDDGSACGEYGPQIEYDSPNARLIAAAPELLAALQEAREALVGANNISGWYDGDDERFNSDIADIDAAIAKATGASHD